MLWKENCSYIEGVQDCNVLKNKPKVIHMMKVSEKNLCSDTLEWSFDQFFVLSQKFEGTIVNVFVLRPQLHGKPGHPADYCQS